MLTNILVDLLYIVIMAGLAVFSKYTIPWLAAKIRGIKNDALREFVEDAICFAENRYDSQTGQDKFAYVFTVAKRWCDDNNIKMNDVDLKIMIESAFTVLDSMHYVNKDKKED